MWPTKIAPKIGPNELDKEPFSVWFQRVRRLIPHVPESVAEHWIHRHWRHSPYEFLPLAQMRFELQTWSLERLHDVRYGSRWNLNSNNLGRLDEPMIRQTTLAQMMIAAGTWPAPIIVVDNQDGSLKHDGKQMARWELIEGHLRLWYLRCLEHRGAAQADHDVWVMHVASRRSSRATRQPR